MSKIVSLLLFASTAFASEGVLDMKTAIEKGLAFSPDVRKAKSQLDQSESTYRLAEAKIFPTLSAKGLTRTNRNSTIYDPTNAVGNSQENGLYSESYTTELVFSQPLYQGGGLQAGLTIAKLQQEIGKQTLFKAKQDYLQNLLTSYYSASANDQKLAMARLNRQIIKAYLDVVQKYVNIGRNRTIDRLQAESNFQLSEAEVLRLQTTEEQSVQDLLKLTGDTQLAHATLDTHFESQPVTTGTLEEAFDRAVQNNPDIRIQKLQVEMQDSQNDLSTAVDWPTLSIDGTAGYNSPDRENVWNKDAEFYTVGLTLTVPLFTGLSSIAQRRSNRESLRQTEMDLVTKDLQIKKNLAVAMATVKTAFDQLKLNRLAAESARKAMDVAMREYQHGLVTSTDVITIQNTRYTAETQFLTAQFSYLTQILNLRHDLGVDLEKVYAAK